MAYFDWNATAPVLAESRQAWMDAVDHYWANPSSVHRPGRKARLAIEEAREEIAVGCGVSTEQVVFTSGATESISGFISGMTRQADPDSKILVSAVEHPAVRQSALHYWGQGRVRTIPVSRDGRIDLNWIEDQLKGERPGLVAVMAANNETGVLSPWQQVRDLCMESGVPFFCDAVQWFGKEPPTTWSRCGGVSVSAHKFGGPKGTGCLILGEECTGLNIQVGGAQENGSRGGTENVAGVLAMSAALRQRQAMAGPGPEARDQFEETLSRTWPDAVSFNGQAAPRLWNTCSVCLPSHKATRWVASLDRMGFQVSTGAACSSGKPGLSGVLSAMGIEAERIRRSIRISSGWETSEEDWRELLQAIIEVRLQLDAEDPSDGPGKVIQI